MANISNINLNGSTFETRPYTTSSTAASTTAKTAALTGFVLYTGATVIVKFTNGNSATAPTLNVNSTGAKSIKCNGAALTAANRAWSANAILEFVYDGTNWNLLTTDNTDTDTNTVYGGNYSIRQQNITTNPSSSIALYPNAYGVFSVSGTVSSVTFSFNSYVTTPVNGNVIQEYCYEIRNGSSKSLSITLPTGVKWENDIYPEYNPGTTTIVSIINKYAVFAEFATAS